jgi:hypothetical protein
VQRRYVDTHLEGGVEVPVVSDITETKEGKADDYIVSFIKFEEFNGYIRPASDVFEVAIRKNKGNYSAKY